MGAAAACCLAWLYLALGRGWFWKTDVRLPAGTDPGPDHPGPWPAVAVIVPARNEEAVLQVTLPGLLKQDYPGPFEVVLVDDRSTDATLAAARSFLGSPANKTSLTVVEGADPPPGWTGKMWALEQGAARSETAGAEYLLLTDADIHHPTGSLRRLVTAATGQRLDMVSLMARLSAERGWERLIVPAFVYFFAQLYPFRWVNRDRCRTAAAAGGCVLVRRRALAAGGGFTAIRGAVIDDVAMAGALKGAGFRIWLGLADDVRSARDHSSLGEPWSMVARSAFVQLRCSAVLLGATVAGLFFLYVLPVASLVAGLAFGRLWAAALGALAWLIMVITYAPMLNYYRRWPVSAVLLPFTATMYLAMTVDSARRHWSGREVSWRGRRHPTSTPTA